MTAKRARQLQLPMLRPMSQAPAAHQLVVLVGKFIQGRAPKYATTDTIEFFARWLPYADGSGGRCCVPHRQHFMGADDMALAEGIEWLGWHGPQRIQLRRTKGWRLPDGVVKVARPGRWGNPFVVTDKVAPGKGTGGCYWAVPTVADAVECFRLYIDQVPGMVADIQEHLRGKDLACWCKPGTPCHADVLLQIANEPAPSASDRGKQ